MARIRTIKPEFWEDEKIAKLSIPCRLFYIGTWNIADDLGVFRANAALLKSKIFPYDETLRVSEVQKYLDALVEARMLIPIIYDPHNSGSGESYYYIRTFRSHQKFDARYPNVLIDKEILIDKLKGIDIFPPPDGDPAGTQRGPNGGPPREGEGEEGNNPPLIPPLEGSVGDVIPESDFTEFWDCYHSITGRVKTDKDAAQTAWNKLSKEQRRKALENVRPYFDSLNDAKYCKKARTYLADKNFNDEFRTAGGTGGIGVPR